MPHGPRQERWLDILERELDNLRAALRWSLDSRAGDSGLRLATALWYFWETRGYGVEGYAWLVRTLEGSPHARDELRAGALNAAGNLTTELTQAQNWFEQSLALSRKMANRKGVGHSLHNLATVALARGEYDRAEALFEESLALHVPADEQWRGRLLSNLAYLAQVRAIWSARVVSCMRLWKGAVQSATAAGSQVR